MNSRWRFRIAGMLLLSSLLMLLAPISFEAIGTSLQRPQTWLAESHFTIQKASTMVNQPYVPHEPILITNNTDFARYGYPGEGTEEQPYLIEGLNITWSGNSVENEHLIEIQYTTVYFCIRNNLLNGSTREPYGIYLDNFVPGTIDSNIITNCFRGIINRADNNTVIHNTVSDCGNDGIYLYGQNNIVTNNTISNCVEAGINLKSWNNHVTYNTVSDCAEAGIKLEDSRQNTIAHNTVFDCREGIHLNNSPQNTLVGNRLINNSLVIAILLDPNSTMPLYTKNVENYLQATVAENVVNNRPLVFWQNVVGGTVPPGAGQVILLNCTGVEVAYKDLTGVSTGVFAAFCTHLNIHHNTVAECGADGILLHVSSQNTVTTNIISECGTGISLSASTNISVVDNTVTECKWGITLENVYWWLDAIKAQHTLANNTVADCETGILLWHSGQNTLLNNTLVKNGLVLGPLYGVARYGFYSVSVENYLQATVAENVVNDRPMVFWQNVRGETVPPGAGQVILLNCTGVEVTRGIMSQVSTGVFAAFCTHLNIHHNTVAECGADGIYLHVSSQNNVTHNTITHNGRNGISLQWGSMQNIVSNNNISYNHGYGIFLESWLPTIEPPYPYGPGSIPMNNTVMLNTFLENNRGGVSQAYDSGQNTVFVNNYWDDHNNIDQNDDGIADTPYPIEGVTNHDVSPLMPPTPETLTSLPLVELFPNPRGSIGIFLVTLLLATISLRRKNRKSK